MINILLMTLIGCGEKEEDTSAEETQVEDSAITEE